MKSTPSSEGIAVGNHMPMLQSWTLPAAIVLLSGLGLFAIQAGIISPTGKPSRDILWLVGGMELSLYVWVRVYSRMTLRRQVLTLAALVAVQSCLYGIIRLDGFSGDGRLILVWRWTPTPEQVFAEERSRAKAVTPPDTSIDLTQTSRWDSPAFRGADRSGRAESQRLATDWNTSPPKLLWRQPIGRGWSSFAVVGDYCITQEQRSDDEVVVCYAVGTGRELWCHRDRAQFDEPTGGPGPRATPTIHDGRVYTLGATGILNCLHGATGDVIWSVDVLADNTLENRLFGMAGSPLIVDSTVVVSPGGTGSSLVAYDLQTGQSVWKGGDAQASYSSPQLASFSIGRQILCFNAEGLFAHDSKTGEVLCSYPWVSNPTERNNVCQPIPLPADGNRDTDCVFVASGYGKGCALFEVTCSDGRHSLRQRWANRNLKAKFSSAILHEGFVYGLDGSIMTCIDVETGERRWKAGRYGYGQLILVGATLLVQLESGDIALVDALPLAHHELARIPALDGRTWNYPVVAGQHLLVRNDREAACFELPERPKSTAADFAEQDYQAGDTL